MEFFVQYVRKYNLAYIIALSGIMLFECFMIVRGVIGFDFGTLRHRLYMVSYVFLMLASLVALIVTVRNRKGLASQLESRPRSPQLEKALMQQ